MHSRVIRNDCWLRGGWERSRHSSLAPLQPGVLVIGNQSARSCAGNAPICTHSAWCCLPRHRPRGTRHKGGSGDLQEAAPGTLAGSYRPAHCPAPCAQLGICRRLTAVPPLRETLREATKQIPSWVFVVSKHCLNSRPHPPTSLQAPARLQHPRDSPRETSAGARPC